MRSFFLGIYFLILISVGLGAEFAIFDVTTIFNIANDVKANSTIRKGIVARIHSRTNALGLPLYSEVEGFWTQKNKELDFSYETDLPNITCDTSEQVCSWELNGWSLNPTSYLKYYSEVKKEKYLYTFFNQLEVHIYNSENYLENSELYIAFTSETIDRFVDNKYQLIRIRHNGNTVFIDGYDNCYTAYEDQHVIYFPRGFYYSDPEALYCGTLYSGNSTCSPGCLIEIQYEDSTLKIYKAGISQPASILHFTTSISCNEYFIPNTNDGMKVFNKQQGLFYSTVTENNEMVSPIIDVTTRKLCLAIVFHVSPLYIAIHESVLEILSEDLHGKKYHLQKIGRLESGLNTKHLNLEIPGDKGPFKLIIRKTNSSSVVHIARVSSCDPNGEEIKSLLPPPEFEIEFKDNSFNVPQDMIYTASANVIRYAKSESEEIEHCWNGGVPTIVGCACPPGFYGSNCLSGCGKNRYGQDCGGLCSLHQRECEGLLMCAKLTGCQCAPGFRGINCNEKCSPGFYGNDCKNKCGHCAEGSTCDIYSGECGACQFGYLPPHCVFETVYYTSVPEISSSDYGEITVKFKPSDYAGSSGPPEMYQIQYRMEDEPWKIYITKDIYESEAQDFLTEKIIGLSDGVFYEIRVLFLDASFNKYDGELVKTAEISTKCDIPEFIDYGIKVVTDTSHLNFSWTYLNTSTPHICPIEKYEVIWKEGIEWMQEYTKITQFEIKDLLPGSKIQFKVRAITKTGDTAPYSKTVTTATPSGGFAAVRNIKIKSRQSTSIDVTWEPPIDGVDQRLRYIVSYKCLERPACPGGCVNSTEGQRTVEGLEVTLNPLLPFTQYIVTVSPENGKSSSIYVGTAKVVPMEKPSPSLHEHVRTNTSLTVFWGHSEVCTGFLFGYNYQLFKDSDALKILDSGFTRNTNITFHNLTASTNYNVKVFVTTNGGWNPESFLLINLSTSATVPEAVRNLTVYKQGRGLLGLRWAEPQNTYGPLKSFSIEYTLGQKLTSHTVEPTHCTVWPHLYCHTIEGLRANRRYNITVNARNAHVDEDGESAYVTGITKESAPTAPLNLKVSTMSSTSVVLQWSHPELANGILRSFLVSIEETEMYDIENCCQIYPFVETAVKQEALIYSTEISGLHPASSYFVSVSGKTVGLGPPQTLTVYTRPPHLPLTVLPSVQVPSLDEVSWLPQEKLPDVNNSEVYSPLIKAYLLLAVLNESQAVQVAPSSGITDKNLNNILQEEIKTPFYFISEYDQESDLEIDETLEETESAWGKAPPSLIPVLRYQLVAVQVTEYNGVYNADVRFSMSFPLSP